MKNFLSQTWVTSALVIIVILLLAVPAFKACKSVKDEKTTEQHTL